MDDYIVVEERVNPQYVAVMTETGRIYCLAGKGKVGSFKFKAGQVWSNGDICTFSIREFTDKFPQYNSLDRVKKELEREDKRTVHKGPRLK